MKVMTKVLNFLNFSTNYKQCKAREVDEDVQRKKDTFKAELNRLEALAYQAKVQGRDWNEQPDSHGKPFGIDLGDHR